ncbi:hypothetical protein H634G_07586 [Metarhizium anisopliae BRIP 53293]|uniref:AB hydrolase-1 domain-containing protein n=1 Tax=Metarhizium anisopliae BRIP 53293 TaxID=1291518 RepID=A0A0D9NWR5_METAN|nr:hypothetical protein H634G_07586 [Metarhizium anisopliae BRIP 53293]KJK84969.1 hypothetical protein H633G_11203 [Metarhizium anisopliae BRIP 53284]
MRSRKGAPFDQIRGFATMDYRLSDLGDDGQGQDNGNKQGRRHDLNRRQSQRRVRHPDHINDVRSAIQSLAQRMQMDKYILIGHSAGGTMAMQLLMGDAALQRLSDQGRQQTSTCRAGRNGTANSNQIPLPDAVITTAGIFDLPLLVDEIGPESKPFYTNFVTQAFGGRRADWTQASPANFAGNFKQMWPGNNVVMLARSQQDTLIDASQLDVMEKKLIADGITPTVVKNLTGQHDVVWQSGVQLANLVEQTLGELNARSTK